MTTILEAFRALDDTLFSVVDKIDLPPRYERRRALSPIYLDGRTGAWLQSSFANDGALWNHQSIALELISKSQSVVVEVCSDVNAWRVVQYDSCRGLEGWTTIAFGLDELLYGKIRYPNLAVDENDLPKNVARRWLMIALTRAVHTLVITILDPQSPIVEILRRAAQRLPRGVVEWTTGPELPAILSAAAT